MSSTSTASSNSNGTAKGKVTTIKSLQIYPIKSCRGIPLKTAVVTRQGLKYDRTWMFVDSKHKFITIREKAEMTLIGTAIDEETRELVVTFPKKLHINTATTETKANDRIEIRVPLDASPEYLRNNCEKIDVQIWGFDTDAYAYTSPGITSAIGQFFQQIDPSPPSSSSSLSSFSTVRLVVKGPTLRPAGGNGAPQHLGRKESVNFPDVLPLLIANQKSMDDVNTRLGQKNEDELEIERFRPNVIVEGEGMDAWEEDRWKTLRFNPVISHPVSLSLSSSFLSSSSPTTATTTKTSFQTLIIWFFTNILGLPWLLRFIFSPHNSNSSTSTDKNPNKLSLPIDVDVSARCARCHVPNVNPTTSLKHPSNQPWNLLYNYRRVDKGFIYKPCFGMLCCPRDEGLVRVGGSLQVLDVMKDGEEHFYIKGF